MSPAIIGRSRDQIVVLITDELHPGLVLAEDDHRAVFDVERLPIGRCSKIGPVDEDLLKPID